MKQSQKLNKEMIVHKAMQMIDAVGIKAFSMRKLAAALHVDPMAIYHHHANKNALVISVIQEMLEAFEISEPSGVWQTDIRNLCHGIRKLAIAHPGVFSVYETFDEWFAGEHRIHEAFHVTLVNAGFSPVQTVQAVRAILTMVEGFAVDEIAGWFDVTDKADLIESLQTGQFPTLLVLVDEMERANSDASFEFALDVVISGLEQTREALP